MRGKTERGFVSGTRVQQQRSFGTKVLIGDWFTIGTFERYVSDDMTVAAVKIDCVDKLSYVYVETLRPEPVPMQTDDCV